MRAGSLFTAFADLVLSGPWTLCADIPRGVFDNLVFLFYSFVSVRSRWLALSAFSMHSPCGRCHGFWRGFFSHEAEKNFRVLLPTQKLREASSATTQTLPVSHPAMLLSTSVPWPSPCMGGRVHPARWSPLRVSGGAQPCFPPTIY